MLDINELLADLNEHETRLRKPSMLPEAMTARLRETFARFGKNPFNVGDLVTPRTDAPMKGHGSPFLVTEVRVTAALFEMADESWPAYCRADTIILGFVGDTIVPTGAPHWMLEAYTA